MSYHDIKFDTTVVGVGQEHGVATFVQQTNQLQEII